MTTIHFASSIRLTQNVIITVERSHICNPRTSITHMSRRLNHVTASRDDDRKRCTRPSTVRMRSRMCATNPIFTLMRRRDRKLSNSTPVAAARQLISHVVCRRRISTSGSSRIRPTTSTAVVDGKQTAHAGMTTNHGKLQQITADKLEKNRIIFDKNETFELLCG